MKRRLLIPEVIQTSTMDCGPAALKALFGGFGVYLSYGRLRELSQTDVDGTSIDTLEELAQMLGMQAEQRMLPVDLVLLDTSSCLPALVVVRLPDGAAHFVVLWRRHGAWVQIMDPAAGRLWIPRQRFLDSLYVHAQPVPLAGWDDWSRSDIFTGALRARMAALRVQQQRWPDAAHQDAALRLAGALCAAGQLKAGAEAERLLALCADHPGQIPAEFWTVRPIESDPEQVMMRGAVLVSALGLAHRFSAEGLPAAFAAVRSEPPPRVWSLLASAARQDGWGIPLAILLALGLYSLGTVIEASLFRWLLDPGRHLQLGGQRLAAATAWLVLSASLLGLRWPATSGLLRLGRHLELRLRAQLLLKIPRLGDRYFQSRLISDMAFRAHSLQLLRRLPQTAGDLLRLGVSLTITSLAITWLYPGSGPLTLLAAITACAVPVLFQPAFRERDLRAREMSTALDRFHLDALLASRPIQAHAAELTLRAAHAPQLEQWAVAGLRQQALVASAEVLQLGLTLAPIVALVYGQARSLEDPSGLLLLVYWASSIPALGAQIASVANSLPGVQNTLLRLLEPLGAPSEEPATSAAVTHSHGVKIAIEGVSVTSGGHLLLDEIDLQVEAGEQVGIVGLSGAGKSSLVGLLLGWYPASRGTVRVDGEALHSERLAQLRRETAWIDPQVQLFRASLFDNLLYGNEADPARLGLALGTAEIGRVLARLPEGLQTELGENGGFISGGEGQRVRMGRALLRSGVRLAVLDEPTRGLDRDSRQRFLTNARQHFRGATVFYITHHIADTLGFDRVVVVEQGRLVEQGPPGELRQAPASRYAELLDAEAAVREKLWSGPSFRRLRLREGQCSELGAGE